MNDKSLIHLFSKETIKMLCQDLQLQELGDPSSESSHISECSRDPQLMEERGAGGEAILGERHLTRISLSFLSSMFSHFSSDRTRTLIHVLFFLSLLSENPLVCSCSSYTQKIWMRQRRKWLDTERRGPKVGPQCAEPRSLQGRHLLAVKVSCWINLAW